MTNGIESSAPAAPPPGLGPPGPPPPMPGPLTENAVSGTSETGPGVHGSSNLSAGVYGQCLLATGVAHSGAADGVLGEGNNGVHGVSRAHPGSGVLGEQLGGGEGGPGVSGLSLNGDGVFGEGKRNGVHGRTASAGDSGVWGENTAAGVGVAGSSNSGVGVLGRTSSASAGDSGVWGDNTGSGFGVSGSSVSGWGISGSSQNGQAGYFLGKVDITGDLSAGNISGATVTCLNGLKTIGDVSHIGNVFHHGDVSCSGDITLTNADCAEDFEISACTVARPGTVMVLNEDGTLGPSSRAYDTRVAGVVSGAGGLQPGIVLGRSPAGGRTPIALIGKVYCQADASCAPIKVGDLLTTSVNKAGHAMKASDPARSFGAVIGKALGPLAEGQGMIPILVALQ